MTATECRQRSQRPSRPDMNISINAFIEILIGDDLETIIEDFVDATDAVFEVEPDVPRVSRAELAAALLLPTQGRTFGADVITRTGKLRTFNAKLYADSFSSDERDAGTVRVIEMNARRDEGAVGGYRRIALEGVKRLHVDGQTYDLDAIFGTLEPTA